MRKIERRILISAYACNPEGSLQLHPGEDLTGWNIVSQLGRNNSLWVITHRYNQRGIECAPVTASPPKARFVFIELSPLLNWLYHIEFAKRIYYYLWQIKAWRVARSLHKEIGFDIAHHVTFGNYWIGSFIGAFLRVPFVWGPVGGGQRTPSGLMNDYSFYGRLAERFRGLAQWIGIHVLISRRLCLRRSKAVLVCNYETRNNIPKKYSSKVHMFPVNGISFEDLSPQKEIMNIDDQFRIITSGRFVRLKGFKLAIRAFSLFAKEVPNASFEIIGSGPDEGSLRALAQSLGIGDRVHFPGWLPRAEVLRRMRLSDVFFFPSYRDGGGAVVAEAMASGLPVVVLNSGGPGFYVEDKWGIKIKPTDPEKTVRAMVSPLSELFSDTPKRLRMGAAARARAEEFFLWDKIGDKIIALYDEILNKT